MAIFRSIAVLVDGSGPTRGPETLARHWGQQLQVPVRTVSWSTRCVHEEGIKFEPADLYVVSHPLYQSKIAGVRDHLFRDARTALIVCPDDMLATTRTLILDSSGSHREGFLTRAARLAASLAVRPVVLTVARSETAARERQRSAREILMAQGVDGDFDFVVGSEVCTALASVACWRRSQLVVFERQGDPPGWRWLRAPTMDKLIGVSSSLVFLAIPEAGVPEPLAIRAHAPSAAGKSSALLADRRSL